LLSAAKYPDSPSEVDMRSMRGLVAGLGQHYPCKLCRTHLRLKLADPTLGPVAVQNRSALATWFCRLHNMVRAAAAVRRRRVSRNSLACFSAVVPVVPVVTAG
jgi:hypothetical protein